MSFLGKYKFIDRLLALEMGYFSSDAISIKFRAFSFLALNDNRGGIESLTIQSLKDDIHSWQIMKKNQYQPLLQFKEKFILVSMVNV